MPARGRGRRRGSANRSPKETIDPDLVHLVGKVVHIPATVYGINVPGMFYRAKVVKRDRKHKHAVVVSFFEDDHSHQWLPISEIKKWVQAAQGGSGQTTDEHSDEYAIETLLQIREKFYKTENSSSAEMQASPNIDEITCDANWACCHVDDSTLNTALHASAITSFIKPKKVDAAVQTSPEHEMPKPVLSKCQPMGIESIRHETEDDRVLCELIRETYKNHNDEVLNKHMDIDI